MSQNRHLRRTQFWLALLLLLALLNHVAASEEKSSSSSSTESAAVAYPEYVSEVRESVVIDGANTTEGTTQKLKPRRPCRGGEISKEKRNLLQRIKKPKLAVNYSVHHIRYRLLSAIDGFQRYGERAEAGIQSKRDMFQGLNPEQQKLINRVASYQEKLTSASAALKRNAELAKKIADHALRYYGVTQQDVDSHVAQLSKEGKPSDHTSVSQALKHFVRDWSEDGIEERDAAFPQILETLQELFPDRSDDVPIKVLIPGSGLGRLAHAVDDLTGFDVTSNEYSAYMNLAYRYITTLPSPNTHAFNPYVESWSHQPTTTELLRQITIPDVPTVPDRVLHIEGDFTTAFTNHHHPAPGTYDVIVTLFFIDTARNLMTYFETIKTLLKPGGKWINLGPLLYGSRPMVELSVEEIMDVVEEMGFVFLQTSEGWGERTLEGREVRGMEARYGLNPRVLTRNSYLAQFWVAEVSRG